MKQALLAAFALLSACAAPSAVAPAAVPTPAARVEAASDVHHGVVVPDPWRWLEDAADPAVAAWTETEAARARAALDALPGRALILQRLRRINAEAQPVSVSRLVQRGGRLFGLRGRRLVAMDAPMAPEAARVVVDPPPGASIDWHVPSPDGSLVAVSVSRAGSEAGDLTVHDAATGAALPDAIARVQAGTAGGDLAWLPDGSGFWYTRYPRAGERAEAEQNFHVEVWRHRLGDDPAKDAYVFGRGLPAVAMYRLFSDASGRLLISVQEGDSNRFAHWVVQPDGRIDPVSGFGDGLIELVFGPGDTLYGVSRARDLRGEIVTIPASRPALAAARVIVAASDAALTHSFYNPYAPTLLVRRDGLFAVHQAGGPTVLRAYDLDGRPRQPPMQPMQTELAAVSGLTDAGPAGVLFTAGSYIHFSAWFALDPAANAVTLSPLTVFPAVPPGPMPIHPAPAVIREFAVSKDGAKIPVNILVPAGARLDGTSAIVITGYGGFGISQTPSRQRVRELLLDNGVLFAEANLRGGAEYGEGWHQAGMLTNKQNVFDDLIAVIEQITAKGYAAKDRVAVMGGSNGGLLVGAVAVQRPDLVRAVVARSGIFDSLRNELDANGAFNVPEYGSVRDAAQFRALLAYSPYHNIRPGVRYPSFLLLTSANDPRVNPMHSRKFAARLRAAGAEALLLEQREGGHALSGSASAVETLTVDQYAFLFSALGVQPR